MRSRQFNKRIEIWQTASVSDGFGGLTVSDALLSSSWAKITSNQPGKASNVSDFGITDGQRVVMFTLRLRNDLDYNVETQYIKYRGKKYSIVTAPTNIDFDDKYIVFAGIEETVKSNDAG